MEKKISYEGKIIKELREYINEFSVEFNEPNTYCLFFEGGSKTTVNKSTAKKLLNELQKQKVLKNIKDDVTKQEDNIKCQNNILRHELIHAFLYECGIDLGMQFHNEECVYFFAMQFNKLANIFEDAGCLDDGKDLDSFRETLKKHHRVE